MTVFNGSLRHFRRHWRTAVSLTGRRSTIRLLGCLCGLLALASTATSSATATADLVGVWLMPAQAGPDADPTLRVPAVQPPPLNAKYRAIYDASERKRLDADARGEPLIDDRTLCLPDGMPKMMSTTFPLEILQGRNSLALIAEFNTQVRHVQLGNASHPAEDELEYTFFGHSIGRWEDNTLIVDTIGMRDSTVLFREVPHSESLRIVERFRLRKPDVLEVEITMIDPVVFTRPWTVTRLFVRDDGVELREFVCTENNRHARATPDITGASPVQR